jgi:5-methyltetrahydropteroyltriglutamate--homocysteine methyltransferase
MAAKIPALCTTQVEPLRRLGSRSHDVGAGKLYFSPGCGMRRVVRYLAFGKLRALAAGAAIVRKELTGGRQ